MHYLFEPIGREFDGRSDTKVIDLVIDELLILYFIPLWLDYWIIRLCY